MCARARFIAWENLIALAACPHYAWVQTQHAHSDAARAHGAEYAYRDQAEPTHGLFAVNTRSDAVSVRASGKCSFTGNFSPDIPAAGL